ncbi:MmpS family transport accessory protein [Mycolicibacterium sp. F2034L]|uniref:MmpS family transport accessory protein n=1 Tax=Mycolicibacterium sp. F2034L TaxID=2926422 RepID=UPI001FF42D84|nr:MmpS family transport accessory protein [Mycolicibacterium sp. F2034L]MCK0176064.1 MmpS family protein [Mycolicibacterium sp. F2034L]
MTQRGDRVHPAVRAVLLVALLAVATTAAYTLPHEPPAVVTVAYEVTGAAGHVEIRYEDADGALSTATPETLPWRRQFTVPADARFVSLSAGRTDASSADVTCRIIADGTLIALDGLSGGYTQCTGALTR